MHVKTVGSTQFPRKRSAEPKPTSPETRELGIDFVEFEQYVANKKPTFISKKWRIAAAGADGQQPHRYTRKKFGGFGQPFWKPNASRSLCDLAEPAANALKITFGGAKLEAAAQAIAKRKVKDTPAFRAHLKVLAAAQQKWEAKKPLDKAKAERDAAHQTLVTYRLQLEELAEQGVAEARQRLEDMAATRNKALAAKAAPASDAELRELTLAKGMTEGFVRNVTVPVEASLGKSKGAEVGKPVRGALKKVKGALLSRRSPVDRHDKAGRQGQRIAALMANQVRTGACRVDPDALREELRAGSAQRDETPQEFIEYLLLDTPSAAYMPPEVFNALRDMHAAISNEAHHRFKLEANAQLQKAAAEVATFDRAYEDALAQYEAVPLPG